MKSSQIIAFFLASQCIIRPGLPMVSSGSPPRFVMPNSNKTPPADIALSLKEGFETPPGTVILTLDVIDTDPLDALSFKLSSAGQRSSDIFMLKSSHKKIWTIQLILLKVLDAETSRQHHLVISVTDGNLGSENFIRQSVLISVEDINDNSPVFLPYQSTINVRENEVLDESAILLLEATDQDSGVFGQVIYELILDDLSDVEKFSLTTKDGRAELHVVKPLDYETASVHRMRVLAKDRSSGKTVNSDTAVILVKVVDTEDQPPEFVQLPPLLLVKVSENVELFTKIFVVKALDGDRGVNRNVVYSVVENSHCSFNIDSKSGLVFNTAKLDRETFATCLLTIRATEEGGLKDSFLDVNVTIIIEDVNDNVPEFNKKFYNFEVGELDQKNSFLTVIPDRSGNEATPIVLDKDNGINGTFRVFLQGTDDLINAFEVLPETAINEAKIRIRLIKPELLDFERQSSIQCILVAQELGLQTREARVPIKINISDGNDNIPQFSVNSNEEYEIYVPENLPSGSVLASIKATDQDSGLYGTQGIRYISLSGSLAKYFVLNWKTGLITLNEEFSSPFDREKQDVHYISLEARDDLGRGNRNSLQIVIHVEDVNDNAPIFQRDVYESWISENVPVFSVPLIIRATDADLAGSENSTIRYRIVSNDSLARNFSINFKNGSVDLIAPLDFEAVVNWLILSRRRGRMDGNENVRTIKFIVQAYDLGTPSFYTEVPVYVYVADVNDHTPTFQYASIREILVPEDVKEGKFIKQVTATDKDGSFPNNHIMYRIVESSNDGTNMFSIDSKSGRVSVAQGSNLDIDFNKNYYKLQIEAYNGVVGWNNSQLSSKIIISIRIVDINNKKPQFNSTMRTVYHVKESSLGVFVLNIQAFDTDISSCLKFYIYNENSWGLKNNQRVGSVNVSALLNLDETTGNLSVAESLDYETLDKISLDVFVEDVNADAKYSPQIEHLHLIIIIEDVNDNAPIFDRHFYNFSLMENSPIGSILTAAIAAVDKDVISTITYSLKCQQSIIDIPFYIDSATGSIMVNGSIDYELVQRIHCTVRASDGGDPAKSTATSLNVYVVDENDNDPEIHGSFQHIRINEDAAIGTVVTQVVATDKDQDEFGRVTYLLDHRSAEDKFRIDADTGEIVTVASLDREQQSLYVLLVRVYDNYRFGFVRGASRHAFTQISVSLIDVNDEIPFFSKNVESDECVAIINEFHIVSDPIMTIQANDLDDASTLNSKLSFEIKSTNRSSDLFQIIQSDENVAQIYSKLSLKGQTGNFSIDVVARDKGFPPNSARTSYTICIQDFNDHAPFFVSPPNNLTIYVAENASLGSEIIVVRALDNDSGRLNGAVRYRIHKGSSEINDTFHVNSITGMITLNRNLDRELKRLYHLRIEAYDLGEPISLQNDLDLTIYVTNINDHLPQFLVDEWHLNFTENKEPGMERFMLVDTVDHDEVDEFTNRSPVCYFIVGGNDREKVFALHPTKHELRTLKKIDRETKSAYVLIVKASENCNMEPARDLKFDANDDTLLNVKVSVSDVDDNSPNFMQKVFAGGLSDDFGFGDVILRLEADDLDLNSQLIFKLIGPIQISNSSEGFEDINQNLFLVDSDTGDVLVNFDAQSHMKGYFQFMVRVMDGAGHFDEAKVLINLLREDQRVRFVMRNKPSEVRTRIQYFRSVLSNVTGAIVSLDFVRIHENHDGNKDGTKTDVLFHFLKSEDNSVMEVDEALELIDYQTEALNHLFQTFNVIKLDSAAPKFFFKEYRISKKNSLTMFWLVGFCVFLVFLLIVLICYGVHQRGKFMRKMKVASTTNSSESIPPLKKHNNLPNTNIHASEGSNPLWLGGIDYDNFHFGQENNAKVEETKLVNNDAEKMNSLDFNIFNTASKLSCSSDEYDNDYAISHFSAGLSTLRVSSKSKSFLKSHSDDSSGLSSCRFATIKGNFGCSRKSTVSSIRTNGSLLSQALSNPSRSNSSINKVENPFFATTTYDKNDLPRTEL